MPKDEDYSEKIIRLMAKYEQMDEFSNKNISDIHTKSQNPDQQEIE